MSKLTKRLKRIPGIRRLFAPEPPEPMADMDLGACKVQYRGFSGYALAELKTAAMNLVLSVVSGGEAFHYFRATQGAQPDEQSKLVLISEEEKSQITFHRTTVFYYCKKPGSETLTNFYFALFSGDEGDMFTVDVAPKQAENKHE